MRNTAGRPDRSARLERQDELVRVDAPEQQSIGTFLFLWAVALLWHLTTHGQWCKSWVHSVLTASATAQLVAPDSVLLLLLTSSTSVAVFASPAGANHEALTAAVGAAFCLAAAEPLLHGRWPRHRDLNRAFATVQQCLITLYVFAFLHKLNTGYLDTETSCAVQIIERIIGSPISSQLIRVGLIYGSLALELFLPLSLTLSHSLCRAAGIAIGVIFHAFVGMRYAAFSLHVLAIYATFFSSPRSSTSLRMTIIGTTPFSPKRMAALVHTAVLAAVAVTARTTKLQGLEPVLFRRAKFCLLTVAWIAVGVPLISQALQLSQGGAIQSESDCQVSRHCLRCGWVLPAVLSFVGMNPYLGLRTVPTFSMFSNLRTEGGYTNSIVFGPAAATLIPSFFNMPVTIPSTRGQPATVWPIKTLQIAPFQTEVIRVVWARPAFLARAQSLHVASGLAMNIAKALRSGTSVDLMIAKALVSGEATSYKNGPTSNCRFSLKGAANCSALPQLVEDVNSCLAPSSTGIRAMLVSSWLRFREIDDNPSQCRW